MRPDSYTIRSPDCIDAYAEPGGHVSVQKVELGDRMLLVIFLMAVLIGTCGVVMGMNLSRQKTLEDAFLKLDRQYRMTELKLDDWTVVAHRAGLQLPGDYTRGPQGALDAESFHINQEKDHGSGRNNPKPSGGNAGRDH